MTKITQLPVASTISDTGVFVIVDQGITKQLSWQTLRSGGLKGNTGTQGIIGPTGLTGPTGTVTTIQIGHVTGTNTASVIAYASTLSTSITLLDFCLPIGPKGDTGTYILTTATTSRLGGVKIGNGISIARDGTISTSAMVIATSSRLGGVKAGNGISITVDGTISATTATQYYLPAAKVGSLGGVKIGTGITVADDGTISVTTGSFMLQTATNYILGGVKIGEHISITNDGIISCAAPYVLPTASTSTIGGVKLGSNLSIDLDGTLSVLLSSITTIGTLTNLVVRGNTTISQTLEVFSTINTASGTVVYDCSQGVIFIQNNPNNNWTANFTNVAITPNVMISVALLINQNLVPYIPSFVEVNGGSFNINWQGGITPTGNASKKDLVNFTFISIGAGNYQVLGSLTSYG